MGCRSILAAAVIAASLLGADASPCKPATSTAISAVQSETPSTVVSEATSTALVETPLTFSTEATSDALIETTPTSLGEAVPTTFTVLTDESSTTLAASTTTTEAETCTETQVIANPGFDNDRREWTPWSVNGELVDYDSYSAPNAMRVSIGRGGSDIEIFQLLFNLKGRYRLSYRYKVQDAINNMGFTCGVRPKIGESFLEASYLRQASDLFVEGTAEWSTEEAMRFAEFRLVVGCFGNYDQLKLHFDDITLTKVCNDHLEPLDTSTTLLETTPTTLAETASTTSVETTLTEATTFTALAEETPTTLAASTTTTEAESCTETQVVINPGFDDNIDGFPWIHDGQVKSDYTPSEPNNLEVTVYYGPTESISQTLHNIKAGEYTFSFRWRIFWDNNPFGNYLCYIMPRIGTSGLRTVPANEPSDMYAYQTGTWYATQDFDEVKLSLEVMCGGEVESIIFNFDDITLTKVCDVNV